MTEESFADASFLFYINFISMNVPIFFNKQANSLIPNTLLFVI